MRYWLTAQLHVSWIIMAWCLAVFCGIVIARTIDTSIVSIGWLLTATSLGIFACIRQQRWTIVLAIISGCLIGLWRGSIVAHEFDTYQSIYGKTAKIQGMIADDIDRDKHGNVVVRLKDIRINTTPVSGKIWVVVTMKQADIRRSDVVTVSGKVSEGFGSFSAAVYRAKLVSVERSNGDVALVVRDWFSNNVRAVISEPESSLGLGFLTGQRRDLPSELEESLRIAGLTHIIVASGYNLTILVRIVRRLFANVSKYMTVAISFGLIISFMSVTGVSPSMSRAGLVTGLALIAWYYGRNFNPFVLLSIAIATTTFIDPSYAWGDIGWQLSFAAFGGVMIIAPILQAYFFGNKKPNMIRQILGETIAATICTLPILLLHFGYMSNVAIIANTLIVPLIPLVMLLVLLSGVTSVFVPLIAWLIATPTTWLLGYMIHTASLLSGFGWSTSEVHLQVWHAVVMYMIVISVTYYMYLRANIDLTKTSMIE